MTRRVGLYLVGSLVLVAMAGCGRGFLQTAEREPWRAEAELACLKSGEVKESANVVRIDPISGPGACGAEFPLKVSALAENSMLGFADDLRPPAAIPSAPGQPRWPINSRPYPEPDDEVEADPPADQTYPRQQLSQPPYSQPAYPPQQGYPQQGYPQQGYAQPPYARPNYPQQVAPQSYPPPGYSPAPRYSNGAPASDVERMPLDPPQTIPAPAQRPASYGAGASGPVYGSGASGNRDYRGAGYGNGAPGAPLSLSAPGVISPDNQQAIDEPDSNDGVRYSPQRPLPPLGPSRGAVGALGPVSVKPAATLACPLVAQLDRWISEQVQPAAQRWFGAPVVEIKQISAYSCRGMNGNPNAHISEHAFGNALDIAAFTLADGRRITVKDGWHGLPEEQGFLRDVQGGACQDFTTVLAPGSNAYHYDHIHVDLMRRASRRLICEPSAVSGEVVAARAGGHGPYASRDRDYTSAIAGTREKHHFVKAKDDDDEDDDD